jgi:ElaB/YqjD/DUF883 family membrane-anchored ribosome-binding protein
MAQSNRAPSGAQDNSRYQPGNIAAIALRSASQVYDINLSATRVLWQTQARAAAAFGLPDWSPLFDGASDRAREVFANSAEQVIQTAQKAGEAAVELQRQVGRVIETQAAQAAESWQRGLEELGNQASEGLNQLCETARETAEEAQRTAQTLGEEARHTFSQGIDQARQHAQAGFERGREAIAQAGDAVRREGEAVNEEARNHQQQQPNVNANSDDKNKGRNKVAA